jgi:hypothetical protein
MDAPSRYEWIVIFLVVVAVLVWEYVSVARSCRKDAEAARHDPDEPGPS